MKRMIINTMNIFNKKKVKMKKFYCIICGKYRKFKNDKRSNIFEKALAFSIICSKCKNEHIKVFKHE